jgi:hypothetical protein
MPRMHNLATCFQKVKIEISVIRQIRARFLLKNSPLKSFIFKINISLQIMPRMHRLATYFQKVKLKFA